MKKNWTSIFLAQILQKWTEILEHFPTRCVETLPGQGYDKRKRSQKLVKILQKRNMSKIFSDLSSTSNVPHWYIYFFLARARKQSADVNITFAVRQPKRPGCARDKGGEIGMKRGGNPHNQLGNINTHVTREVICVKKNGQACSSRVRPLLSGLG